MTVTVQAVPYSSDNYAWLLRDQATGTVAICDPGEAAPVIAALDAAGGRCDLILLTHHHGDHVNGVDEVRAKYGAKVIGAQADAHRLPKLDIGVIPGDTVSIGETEGRVIDSPGHTIGHIAFYFPDGDVLLCGDTLFSLGCGRLLEGTAEDMFRALSLLKPLPPQTLVCCGHEYTESNARFALTVEPDNQDLKDRAAAVAAARAQGRPTVPVTLGEEMKTNPFLRASSAKRLGEIRAAKDNFRG
ncbi:hydroxyacylglutathione hydrolase [Roseomonas marmotae]|uniref:Hydroxyacylglutathione hydrolase n=1 Tax=Roseomonas marmotae TaxID=2768161 RepID=A0ABS3KAE8_9PROT|nr:hydroxyacylglutathione hydrolase [Roseomonas marmotae]MBO1073997.1 hydroxyacylglutathione hydrolase [Roseomonas marmotae]QTI78785.1 hydroxyacylglutathione hydrolase [Roseomonas marmotae]